MPDPSDARTRAFAGRRDASGEAAALRQGTLVRDESLGDTASNGAHVGPHERVGSAAHVSGDGPAVNAHTGAPLPSAE